uniref:Endonuclease/exonuclease/phosphatase domain-containing protein n=1 Tax=Macaca mulatta TaxID=9544 RepID=A0A5F7ZG29_MACMU
MSDKTDCKATPVKKEKKGHYIMIKYAVQQEIFTILNVYAPNAGAPKFIKQLLLDLRNERDSNTIIVGDVSTPLTALHKSSSHQQRNNGLKLYSRRNGLNRHLQNIPSNNCRIYILFLIT